MRNLLLSMLFVGLCFSYGWALAGGVLVVDDDGGVGVYTSIQAAVNAAQDGDIILVMPGSYQEQVLVGLNLALSGTPGAVILAPGSNTYQIAESSRTWDPIVFVYGGTLVGNLVSGAGTVATDVTGFEIDGQNLAPNAPIRFAGILYRNASGEISGNVIHDMFDADGEGNGPETFGILVYGDSVVDILNNVVSDFSRGGIGVNGDMGAAPDPVAHIEGNVVTGNGMEVGIGWWAENGIQIGYGATGEIVGNVVTDCWVNNPNWTASGIIVVSTDDVQVLRNIVDNNESGIVVAGFGPWGWPSANRNEISENDVIGNAWGVSLQMDANDTLIYGNNVHDNLFAGITVDNFWGFEPIGTEIHYNSIVGNGVGVENWQVSSDIDATLNWWGSPDGPTADLDGDGVPEYDGGGDGIWGPVTFSPWLGIDPDGDPLTPGVQVVSPMLFIVDDVGPAPVAGYLNTAIQAANNLPGTDTIEVRHGTYDASEPITEAVEIVSEVGTASNTFLTGNMALKSAGILLGRLGQGFTINGDITVSAGVDASTIHINWNNILGTVINNGDGALDATYNWWGDGNPSDSIVGFVVYYPFLPRPVDDVISFMDRHGLLPDEAILVLGLVDRGVLMTNALLVVTLMHEYGFTADEALQLIRDYGRARVHRAMRHARDYSDFVRRLFGYNAGPAGGAGGFVDRTVAGGAAAYQGLTIEAIYPVGMPIVISFTLTDYQGKPVTDSVCTVTLVKLEDGRQIVWYFDVIPFDGEQGLYRLSVPTDGLEPGYYLLYIAFGDGTVEEVPIEIVD
ncbi:MAG: hypothetical protein DRI26_04565 [Chloroflexi bacterium]|nr:MAG: hypothetical protein DRI26_04565 [Chloroflexota bacterium]